MELLCIKTHEQGSYKAGKIYNLIEIKTFSCGCKLLNIGLSLTLKRSVCFCQKVISNNIHWVNPSNFVEIGNQDEHSTYEKKEELIEKL